MNDHVIEIRDLSRRFDKTLALDGVSLDVQPGLVYGLVGANGQGKTTLIKHVLGLLRPQQGSVRVFESDPVKNPVDVLQRIGYLSENRDLPEWMRIGELLRYSASYYPNWDMAYARDLTEQFGLNHTKKVKHLSKGMRAQVGLIVAVAHRPELLLLDEPSTGLDAVVRRDILNAIVRNVAEEGRVALFSSHLLDEVEQMSDHIVMMNRGQIVLDGSLDTIKANHISANVRLPASTLEFPEIAGALSASQRGDTWNLLCESPESRLQEQLVAIDAELTSSRTASLQEIFVARVGRDRLATVEA
ncbi:MAG: ABC transporter ATP-binding protein [Rubripirellula sp.]